jgi:hypothetical protein
MRISIAEKFLIPNDRKRQKAWEIVKQFPRLNLKNRPAPFAKSAGRTAKITVIPPGVAESVVNPSSLPVFLSEW